MINASGVERVCVIEDMKLQANVLELQRTMGMVQYLGHCLPKWSSIISLMAKLFSHVHPGKLRQKAYNTINLLNGSGNSDVL